MQLKFKAPSVKKKLVSFQASPAVHEAFGVACAKTGRSKSVVVEALMLAFVTDQLLQEAAEDASNDRTQS